MSMRNQAVIDAKGFVDDRQIVAPPSERLLKIVYMLGIPLMLGALIGWARVGPVAAALPRELAVLYWGGISLLLWNTKFLLTWFCVRIGLLSARPHLIGLATLACVAEIFLRPLHRGIVMVLATALGVTDLPFHTLLPGTFTEMLAALVAHSPLIAVWMLTTAFYLRALGVNLFSSATHRVHRDSATTPISSSLESATADLSPRAAQSRIAAGLLDKLPPGHGRIRALRALDHYVQVFLDDARPMFIHRFDDAAREFSSLGLLRIHRSFCVHPSAVTALESRGRRKFVVLESGEKLPVSTTYLETLLAARDDLRR